MAGERGSGSGKGGGSGGSIRESGGAFGKQEAAREDQYFRQQSAEQLTKLKSALDSQIASHQKLIKEHQEAIDQAKKAIDDLEGKKWHHFDTITIIKKLFRHTVRFVCPELCP